MAILSLTETIIRDRATAKVFQRGEQYYRSGAVANICSRGNTIQATVEGNEIEPYRVSIQFDSGGVKSVSCTCAYDFGGWCKHLVATALICLRQPETVKNHPSLSLEAASSKYLPGALSGQITPAFALSLFEKEASKLLKRKQPRH